MARAANRTDEKPNLVLTDDLYSVCAFRKNHKSNGFECHTKSVTPARVDRQDQDEIQKCWQDDGVYVSTPIGYE